jgi:D-glycero-D-manno-heptose 1,7-bisphosphate phosphatase
MKAVFLDRDGVINRARVKMGKPYPPTGVGELEIIEGVSEGIRLLKDACLLPVVVTNQPDISRGNLSQDVLAEINSRVKDLTGLEHFYICSHDDFDMCECRKPKPGLIYAAAKELGIQVESSYLIGDRWRDIAAGQAAGCRTYFIDYSYEEKRPKLPFVKVGSLLEGVQSILKIERRLKL